MACLSRVSSSSVDGLLGCFQILALGYFLMVISWFGVSRSIQVVDPDKQACVSEIFIFHPECGVGGWWLDLPELDWGGRGFFQVTVSHLR